MMPAEGTNRALSRISFTPKTVFPSWAGEDTIRGAVAQAARAGVTPATVLSCRRAGRQVRAVRAGTPAPRRPRLLVVGPQDGALAVLVRHLEAQADWDIDCLETLAQAADRLGDLCPDVLLAVWAADEPVKERVQSIRDHRAGQALPVILLGSPVREGVTSPVQPVRGVLCLPGPLKWRTLLLCLEEHLRALAGHHRAH
jgi:hypothetical protein